MPRSPAEIDPERAASWIERGVPVALISLVNVSGSAPRTAGTAMLVTHDALSGTIGGGALEWALIGAAREMLRSGRDQCDIEQALGPEIGQCCGGKVKAHISRLTETTVQHLFANEEKPTVCIFGAGHVGAALARSFSLLPVNVEIIDQRPHLLSALGEFGQLCETALPEAQVATAPAGTAFIVTTHDHALDFMIVEAALHRGDAAYVGMIGSASKRAILAKRLTAAGLSADGLTCPIGAGVSRDKRPEIIAAMVAAEVIEQLF